ncbi:MAG: hypothetical protein U0324_45890 [Polyangiales bacterium]
MRDDANARERVLAFTQARKLLSPGQRVLVGVGGGSRSLGLMALLAEAKDDLGLAEVAVASIEPVLDEEADAAEVVADVGRLARALGLDFYAARPAPTRGRRVDVQGELTRIARDQGFHRVALGNTRDDDAVRVLCELCRGGADRVRGLGPRVKGGVVRPFLVLSDAEAARFVPPEAAGWSPGISVAAVPDEDRVRREILPRLRVVFPGVELHLQELGRQARARRRLQASHTQRARG